MRREIRPFVLLACCGLLGGLEGPARGAGGTVSGVVLAQRDARDGRPELLLAVPARVGGSAIDGIRIELPKKIAKRLSGGRLPRGWTSAPDKRGLLLQGPPAADREVLALALGIETGEVLPETGIQLLHGGKTVASTSSTPRRLARPGAAASPDGFVRLPQALSPGERISFQPLDADATPGGGSWVLDEVDADWNGSLSEPEYEWSMPVGYGFKQGLDLRLRISYTDPWGERLVDGSWDGSRVVDSPARPAGGTRAARIEDCSPEVLTGGIFCVCGTFPTPASRTSLTLNGRPLGPPLSASRHVLNFRLPEGVPPGRFAVAGTAAGGFGETDSASGVHVAVGGEIDRERLFRGESTPLRLWLEGTEEPVSLRLWNSTPEIVALEPENDQTVTTSGGSPNELTRTVHAVSPGDFVINYELARGSCPCAERLTKETTPAVVAEDEAPSGSTGTTVVMASGTGTRPPGTECAEQRAECERLETEAENAEARARTLEREAERLTRDQRIEEDADWLDEVSEKDRTFLETLRRQAAEWRKLAAAARASAARNRARDRKYPRRGWDYWAARDQESARRRDAEAKRLEDQVKDLTGKIRRQSQRAQELRDRVVEAEAAAAKAAAAARQARSAYEACLARLVLDWPEEAEPVVVAGGTGTSTTTDDDGDDPRDTPPPTPYGEEIDEEKACPQRDGKHKECVALLIDIARYDNWRPGSLTDTKDYLEEMGCDLDYVAPRFHSVPPKSYLVEESIWSWSEMRFKKTRYWVNTTAQREAAQRYNRSQMATVTSAIERHRGKLRSGAVLGLEMFYGHGSSNKWSGCGRFGPSPDWWNNSLSRRTFHEENYKAAKGNVCIWYVADFSCYSYLSARAVDNLNNVGRTNCFYGQGFNRPLHAGYEADIAHTCGHQGVIELCSNYDIAYLEDDIDDVFEEEIARQKEPGYGSSNAFSEIVPGLGDAANSSLFSFSTYSDQGYEKCVPPTHVRRGPY